MVLPTSAKATKEDGHEIPCNVQIKSPWCKGCGICVAFCPRGVFGEDENGLAIVAANERCTLCGLCELLCPELAITTQRHWTKASQHHLGDASRMELGWPEPPRPIPCRSGQVTLMQGNEACAEAALAAGMRFFAGYPITPSSDIPEILSRRLPRIGGVFIQMEDELASLAAVIGASIGGLRAMTATSGPGFSLMQENLGYAITAELPCVVVNVQRAGPSTGQPTGPAQGDVMQCRWGTHGDHPIIVLCPSSVAETYLLTFHAFTLAERYRTPVVLLTDEVVAHMRERVIVPAATVPPRRPGESNSGRYLPYDATFGDVPPLVSFGHGVRYHVTGLHHDPAGFPTQRSDEAGAMLDRLKRKIDGHVDEITLVEEESTGDADVLVLAYGVTARSARDAMLIAREAGQKLGFLKVLTLWPFPERDLRRLASQVRAVIVPEMNQGQLRLEVERIVGHRTEVIGINRVDGALISPDQILAASARVC